MARVLVLCGGEGPERRVSLAGGDAVARGLAAAGHEVIKIDTAKPDTSVPHDVPLLKGAVGATPPSEQEASRLDGKGWATLVQTLASAGADMIFPILHGGWGEDGRIQALFELLAIRYLGSGVLASQLAINKALTKAKAKSMGAYCAEGFLTEETFCMQDIKAIIDHSLTWPVVVKPNRGGSSANVVITDNAETVCETVHTIRNDGDDALIEEYIPGREVTVTVLGREALPLVEIVPKSEFYDYTRKYTKGETQYICPAEVSEPVVRAARKRSLDVFEALGCRDVARVDWRLTPNDRLVFLELNTIPGMTDLSLVPMAAAEQGLDFPGLMQRFVELVEIRTPL
ncbi:D-alanine--D-alanine ligase [bacterium]|nr:D-alanine--D-alanine ligase [bacterium]